MTIFDTLIILLVYGLITAGGIAVILYRRMQSPQRVRVRVHKTGGTEKLYPAVELGEEIIWIQDGEKQTAKVPLQVLPGHTDSWGVHYRIFDLIHGADKVLIVPWLKANIRAEHLKGEAAATQRYRSRVNALNVFEQLAKGLGAINRWQSVALILLGMFAGLWLAPFIQGAVS